MRVLFFAVAGMVLAQPPSVALFGDDAVDRHGITFFEKRIRPVLVEHCYECHSGNAKEVEGGLLLDTRVGARRGGSSGRVIVPGEVEKSLLISAIRHEKLEMPPGGKLPDHVVADFVKWIEIGAPDPRDGERPRKLPVGFETAREYWAFRPLNIVSPATRNDESSAWSEIDHYVSAKRSQKSLQANPPADKYTLLRRVYIDLIGLPPAPEEVTAFVNDDSPDAYEKVVDRLLSSTGFGERWGRHWLDLAQYADTLDSERAFPNLGAWRYRDYVIRAFNQDKPFNRFIIEQLAGDFLPHASDAQRAEQIVATQFLTQGPINLVNQFKEQLRMDVVDNQVDKVGRVFMAMTFGCARCHDHKFDPLGQEDYYALAGILQNVKILAGFRGRSTSYSDWIRRPIPETPEDRVDREWRMVAHRQRLSKLETEFGAVNVEIDQSKPGKKALAKLTDKLNELRRDLRDHVKANVPEPPTVLAASEPARPTNARINIRGNALQLGEEIQRGLPRVLMAVAEIPETESGRMQLARSLVYPDNPIVSRVFVNRIWHHLFGVGIVRSVDNFGRRGEKPSHPDLLDFLAHRFVAGGWEIKPLIRGILLSRTYRLSSDHDPVAWSVDPENRLLWRHSPRRLDAESIRDSILKLGDSLSALAGGPTLPPSVWDTQPIGQFTRTDPGKALRPDVLQGRSVYLPVSSAHVKFPARNGLRRFDSPSPHQITGARRSSIVATQSLYLLNSPFVSREAEKFAESLLARDDESEEDRINRIYLSGYGRQARPLELRGGLDFLRTAAAEPVDESGQATCKDDLQQSALTRLCHAVLISTEFLMHD